MRRKQYLLLVVALAMLMVRGFAFAQSSPIDTGSKIISGSLGFSRMWGELYFGEEGGSKISIWANPSMRYFVRSGLALGVKVPLSGHYSEHPYTDWDGGDAVTKFLDIGWGIGPRLSYFIGGDQSSSKLKGKIYPFLDFSCFIVRTRYAERRWSTSLSRTSDTEWTSDYWNLLISPGLGICYMLSQTFGLTVNAVYDIEIEKYNRPSSDYGERDVEIGNEIYVSVGTIAFLY